MNGSAITRALSAMYGTADLLRNPSTCQNAVNDGWDWGPMLRDLGNIVINGGCQCVVWDKDVWDASAVGCESFLETVADETDIPRSLQFWVIDGLVLGVSSIAAEWDAEDCRLIGIFIDGVPNADTDSVCLGQVAVFDRGSGVPLIVPHLGIVPGEMIREADALIIARHRFMGLPFVSCEEEQPPRAARKLLERDGRSSIPHVRTVLLRKAVRSTKLLTDAHREYHCQFLVSAHWRRPSSRMKEQRPVFVRPYVKGPGDKPLRMPRTTVYAVAR